MLQEWFEKLLCYFFHCKTLSQLESVGLQTYKLVVSFSRNCRFCVEYHCKTERFSVITAPWHETLSSDTASWLWLAPCSTQSRMVSFSIVDWTPAAHFSLTSSALWQGSVCDSWSMPCLNQMEFVHCVIFLCGCNPSCGRGDCENRTASVRGLLVSWFN